LITDSQPVDISDIISDSIINLTKIHHINFSKILKDNKNFYQDHKNIWAEDNIHLNDENYDIFIEKLVKRIN
jgi:lysophospholipase L1-like esterase